MDNNGQTTPKQVLIPVTVEQLDEKNGPKEVFILTFVCYI